MKANFYILSSQKISQEFQKRNISDFQSAVKFVRHLPYGRNTNKQNPETLFADGCGTCSTKHALLKQLAIENNQGDIKLFIGLFKMNAINTPKVKSTLKQYQLDFIPEAHCYLKTGNDILDATKINSQAKDFVHDLIEETEILPEQITDFKVSHHKNYLQKWLNENRSINYSLGELWNIREQCIRNLADK